MKCPNCQGRGFHAYDEMIERPLVEVKAGDPFTNPTASIRRVTCGTCNGSGGVTHAQWDCFEQYTHATSATSSRQ